MTKYIIIWRPLPSKGGLGSQVLAKLTAIAYAEYHGYEYLHVEWDNNIHRIGHNYYDNDNFEKDIENFFKLGNNKRLYADICEETEIKNNLIIKNKFNEVTDNPNIYFNNNFVIKLQHEFYQHNTKFIKNENMTIVNIHIRRGDACLINEYNKANDFCYHPDYGITKVSSISLSDNVIEKGDGHPIRIVGNDYYINIMNKIKNKYKNIVFNIISQGKEEDFNDIKTVFSEFKINFYLNEELINTFKRLYSCDILVLGKSALSYCAGLYSENIVIANVIQNNWGDKIPNLPNWIIL